MRRFKAGKRLIRPINRASADLGPPIQQRPLQIAILAGTTALVMFLSLLATTTLLYRHLAFAPSKQVAASTADEPLDLQTMSTFRLLATSARILAPATAPVVTVGGFEGGDIFQRDFGTGGARLELRLRFLQWLMMLGMGAGLILLMIRRFHMTHYATPLTALRRSTTSVTTRRWRTPFPRR